MPGCDSRARGSRRADGEADPAAGWERSLRTEVQAELREGVADGRGTDVAVVGAGVGGLYTTYRLLADAWTSAQAEGERFETRYVLADEHEGFSPEQLFRKVIHEVLAADPWARRTPTARAGSKGRCVPPSTCYRSGSTRSGRTGSTRTTIWGPDPSPRAGQGQRSRTLRATATRLSAAAPGDYSSARSRRARS